jgi:predicted nucleic acid-binding protein
MRNPFLTLEEVGSSLRIFVDAPIFIYHFTGVSSECRRFLERCERSDLKALTSIVTVAEVAHRLMTIEAVTRGLVSPGNVARKLRERPEIVARLQTYQQQVERIPLMSIEVLPLDLGVFLRSGRLRTECGLLVNDSLAAATALERSVTAIASSDPDFERVKELDWYRPSDI